MYPLHKRVNQKRSLCIFSLVFVVILYAWAYAETVAYRLAVARNDAVVGGEVYLDLQMRITEGTVPRTLHSFTLDVYYSSDLAASPDDMSTGWAFGLAQGYRCIVSKLSGYYRVLAAGQFVNEQGGGVPPGWLLTNNWQTVVRLKWIIQNVNPLNVTVHHDTDCAAYFVNLSNNPVNLAVPYTLIDEGLYQPPLAVELSSFSLTSDKGFIKIEWVTEREEDNLGFNILRSEGALGPYQLINSQIIPTQGEGQGSKRYSYRDTKVAHNICYYYKLEQIDRDGSRQWFGPIKIVYQDREIPDQFYVRQNYPNPFNAVTVFEFGLPQSSKVRIILVNMRGEVLYRWPEETMPAGRHRIQWDGRDQAGAMAASGIYFLKVETDAGQAWIKSLKLQ